MQNEMRITVYASWLNGEPFIGTLYYNFSRGKEVYSFEYSNEWLSNYSNIFLDPDLCNIKGRQFVSQNKIIFGLFSDYSPDRWGRTLLKRKELLTARLQNRQPKKLYELDYLLGVCDELRIGGLRFRANNGEYLSKSDAFDIPPLESIRKLENASIAYENDKNCAQDKWLQILLKPGSSLGGARPKAVVKDIDGTLWIAKLPSKDDEVNTGAWELTANKLATMCGLNTCQTQAKCFSKIGATFLSKRFDRVYQNNCTKRVHYISALTALGKIDGDEASYIDIANFIKTHCANPQKDLTELWKRLLFNVLISNTDDHLRNHGFLLNESGLTLSPIFDINPNPYDKFMSLNITDTDNTKCLKNVMDSAKHYGLSISDAKNIAINFANTIKNNWKEIAKTNKIAQIEIQNMAGAFEDDFIIDNPRKNMPPKKAIDYGQSY